MALKPNKDLGPDCSAVELYKLFKEVLRKKLQEVFTRCLEDKRFPLSWTSGKTVLIPNSDKDLTRPHFTIKYRL